MFGSCGSELETRKRIKFIGSQVRGGGLFLLLIAASTPAPLFPQSLREVEDDVVCRNCRIVISSRTGLRLDEAPELPLVRVPVGVKDSRGNYWLLIHNERKVAVFDSSGAFLRVIGGSDDGEVQFQWPNAGFAVGDSVVVFDEQLHRALVFGPDFQVHREVEYPGIRWVTNVTPLDWPQKVLLNSRITTPDLIGLPLHLVDMSGNLLKITRSAYLEDETTTHLTQFKDRFRLGTGSQGGAWIVDECLYRVSRWDGQGQWESVLTRGPSWFDGVHVPTMGNDSTPPSPRVASLIEDSAGRVWVFLQLPSPGWQEAWAHLDLYGWPAPDPARLYRTTIEVLDPALKRVVTRRELLDFVVVGVLNGSDVMTYSLGPNGDRRVGVLTFGIQGG